LPAQETTIQAAEVVMAWPERAVLILAATIAGAFAVFWLLLAVGVGSPFVPRLNVSVVRWTFETEAAIILPVWLLLKIVQQAIGWAWPRQASPVFSARLAARPADSLGTLDLTQAFSEKDPSLARERRP
jgi:hypothetical protein